MAANKLSYTFGLCAPYIYYVAQDFLSLKLFILGVSYLKDKVYAEYH